MTKDNKIIMLVFNDIYLRLKSIWTFRIEKILLINTKMQRLGHKAWYKHSYEKIMFIYYRYKTDEQLCNIFTMEEKHAWYTCGGKNKRIKRGAELY